MAKNPNLTLSGADLAALLCSRVCHDVISPVGAINNGLELLDEGGADADALDLIRTSALNASVRLKLARLAFGASGSVGASIEHLHVFDANGRAYARLPAAAAA